MAKRNTAGAFLLVVASVASPASAQVTIPEEYGKTVKVAEVVGTLGADLFGEEVNFYTGATTFVATDVSLPGNNALPVALGRRLTVGSRHPQAHAGDGMWRDWDFDIPHLEGVFAAREGWAVENLTASGRGDPQQRCSASGLAEPLTVTGTFQGLWQPSQYWQGYQMHIPGAGSQELLRAHTAHNPHQPNDGKTYHWTTTQHWVLSCLPATANGTPGEGFLAVSPDGVRYRFDWVVSRPVEPIVKEKGAADVFAVDGGGSVEPHVPVGDSTSLNRVQVWILPTRVIDRFGNTVTYTFDPAHPWRLQTIDASDGRKLTLRYTDAGRIASVSDGTREWQYVETTDGLNVVLPDGTQWVYATRDPQQNRDVREAWIVPYSPSSPTPFCQRAAGSATQPIYTASITHPSGAVGTFRFQSRVHGRSYVRKVCLKSDPVSAADHARYPYLFDAIGMLDKTITGPGLPEMRWTYSYGPPNQSWAENCSVGCTDTKTLDVIGPEGWTRYTFSNRWEHSEGKLLKVEQGNGPSDILRTETTTYLLDPAGQRYPATVGINPYEASDHSTQMLQPVVRREIRQQGVLHTWKVEQNAGVYDLDHLARPTTITRSSAPAP